MKMTYFSKSLIPNLGALLVCLALSVPSFAQINNAIFVGVTTGLTSPYFSALTGQGISYTDYTNDQPAYAAAIAAADPATDMVIVDLWNATMDHDAAGLPAFIASGGKVVFSDWRIGQGFSPTHAATAAALGIQSANGTGGPGYNLYDWGGSNLFDGLPNTISFNAVCCGLTHNKIAMIGMGTQVAGFALPPFTPNETAILIGNNGNTVALGYCAATTTDPAEGELLALNAINAALGGGNTAAVPTMGEWGLIILALLVLSFGTVFMMRRQMAFAGAGNVSMSQSSGMPFDRTSYGKMLAVVMLGLVAVFAVSVLAFGYEMTNADLPGALIAGPIGAYLLHLLFGGKK